MSNRTPNHYTRRWYSMTLKNAGSQIAFTSAASNMYAAIIVGHVEEGLVQKHYISPLSMPVMAFTCPVQFEVLVVSGILSERNGMRATSPALKRRLTVEADRFKPVVVLQVNSTLVCHSHAEKMVVITCCGHITWSRTCSSLQMTLFSPLVPYMHNCHSSMPCTCHNVKV